MSGQRMETLGLQVTSTREQVESSGLRLEQERKAASQASASFQNCENLAMQLQGLIQSLEEQIAQRRAALAQIQSEEDDSGAAEGMRAQLQAQIAQLESQQQRAQQRLRDTTSQAEAAQQKLEQAGRQIQVETNTLRQTRSSLMQMDAEYTEIIRQHRAASSQMGQIGGLRYGGSGQQSARKMDQTTQICTQERSRIAQIQARIAHYLQEEAPEAAKDGPVQGYSKQGSAARTQPGGNSRTAAPHAGAAPAGSAAQGSKQVTAAQPAEHGNEPGLEQQGKKIPFGGLAAAGGIGAMIGGLVSKVSRKKRQEPEKETVHTLEEDRQKFKDRIRTVPDDKYAQPITPRKPGGDPVKDPREWSRGGNQRGDDIGRGGPSPLSRAGISGTWSGVKGQGIHWSKPRTQFKKPAFIPESWKSIHVPHSVWEDTKLVNPLYNKDVMAAEYNCQRCVIAGEMRRRGYDVEATLAKGEVKYVYNEERDEIVFVWDADPSDTLVYDDGPDSWTKVFEGAVQESCAASSGVMSARKICQKMKNWGDGSRAIVSVMWAGIAEDDKKNKYFMDEVDGEKVYRDVNTNRVVKDPKVLEQMKEVSGLSNWGHVIKAEQINGETHFFDEQSGQEIDPKVFFRQVRGGYTEVMRVDNLEPTELVLKCCRPREER